MYSAASLASTRVEAGSSAIPVGRQGVVDRWFMKYFILFRGSSVVEQLTVNNKNAAS